MDRDPRITRWARCRRYLRAVDCRIQTAVMNAARDGFECPPQAWIVALGQILREDAED
jgi:hypothetical protein